MGGANSNFEILKFGLPKYFQSWIASGRSNPAHLGELGGNLLPLFPINRLKGAVLRGRIPLVMYFSCFGWKELFPWRKSKLRHFRNIFVGNYAKIFNHSLSFIVCSSLFFDLQLVSTPNRAFQFILCARGGHHLFCVLLFSFHLLSVPPFDVLQSFI